MQKHLRAVWNLITLLKYFMTNKIYTKRECEI